MMTSVIRQVDWVVADWVAVQVHYTDRPVCFAVIRRVQDRVRETTRKIDALEDMVMVIAAMGM